MNVSSGRKNVIYFIFFSVAFIYLLRLFYIQVIDESYTLSANNNVLRLVTDYPTEVVELAELIVERHVREGSHRVRIDDAMVIVRAGLASPDPSTKRHAARLADQLIERGFEDIRILLPSDDRTA